MIYLQYSDSRGLSLVNMEDNSYQKYRKFFGKSKYAISFSCFDKLMTQIEIRIIPENEIDLNETDFRDWILISKL